MDWKNGASNIPLNIVLSVTYFYSYTMLYLLSMNVDFYQIKMSMFYNNIQTANFTFAHQNVLDIQYIIIAALPNSK